MSLQLHASVTPKSHKMSVERFVILFFLFLKCNKVSRRMTIIRVKFRILYLGSKHRQLHTSKTISSWHSKTLSNSISHITILLFPDPVMVTKLHFRGSEIEFYSHHFDES